MSIWKLRLGLNPFTLLLSVLVGLCLVCSYFYLLSFLLGAASPDQGPGADTRRRHLLLAQQTGSTAAVARQGAQEALQAMLRTLDLPSLVVSRLH
mmetsp:Transcript_6531/g.10377  ORF Transcript_6531/g.10377 Transcript_6531/m.10377 type:complete len:95 (+) Transcript_6531:66-350(+)